MDHSNPGPSDWWRRSPSPSDQHVPHPPQGWRQGAAQEPFSDQGPSDVWALPEGDSLSNGTAHPAHAHGNWDGAEESIDTTRVDESETSSIGTTHDTPPEDMTRYASSIHPSISRLRSNHRPLSGSVNPPRHSRTPSRLSIASDTSVKVDNPSFRFYPLRKIPTEHGAPFDVAGMVAVGSSSGRTVVYSFAQEIKHSLSIEESPTTAIRISPDQTFIAVGHASGNIHLWDLSRPLKPVRSAIALTVEQHKSRRKDGHLQGVPIRHVDFVGSRHTSVFSGDDTGKAFWWSLGRVMGVDSIDVLRILGSDSSTSSVLALASLPAAQHETDARQIAAILTPTKLLVVGMKPKPSTLFRRTNAGATTGCVAWLKAGSVDADSDPVLAYSWDNTLHFLRMPGFAAGRSITLAHPIVSLAWFDSNHILVAANDMILIDVRTNNIVETTSSPGLGLLRVYKDKIFQLSNTVQAGSLLYWNDKILTCVHRGDFLAAINLAIAYHQDIAPGNRIGLPGRDIIANRIRELVSASLRWAFSEERMRDDTHYSADGRGVDLTDLFTGLAETCIRASIITGDLDDVFEHYQNAGIDSVFLFSVEPMISQMPPSPVVANALLDILADEPQRAEDVIWSVDPAVLDINRAINLCANFDLWDAMIHVYTTCLKDYTTPIVRLLGRAPRHILFTYLEAVLSAEGDSMGKTSVYRFLFQDDHPYFSLLLDKDTEATLHVLDIAFEDPYLNDDPIMSRQAIVDVLLENPDTFRCIFVAKNIPKYPQFIRVSPANLQKLLLDLARNADASTRDDRQLAAEFLLSVYRPDNIQTVMTAFEEGRFWRLLCDIYRREQQYGNLARTLLNEADSSIFQQLIELQTTSPEVRLVTQNALPQLLGIDVARTARLVDDFYEHNLELSADQRYIYLGSLLESPLPNRLGPDQRHDYVQMVRQRSPDRLLSHLDGAEGLDARRLIDEFADYPAGQLWALNAARDPRLFASAARLVRQDQTIAPFVVRLASERDNEDDWFQILRPILDIMAENSDIRQLVMASLTRSTVSLPRLFARLIDANEQSTEGSLRPLLVDVLETMRVEEFALSATKNIILLDAAVWINEFVQQSRKGWRGSVRS